VLSLGIADTAGPRISVGIGGAGELHAAFLNESRTRGSIRCSEAGNPGSLGMTNLGVATTLQIFYWDVKRKSSCLDKLASLVLPLCEYITATVTKSRR
jgi:hypothetical protein